MFSLPMIQGGGGVQPDVDITDGGSGGSVIYTFSKDYDEAYIYMSKQFNSSSTQQGTASFSYSGNGTVTNISSYLSSSSVKWASTYRKIENVKTGDTCTLTATQYGSGTPTKKVVMIGW